MLGAGSRHGATGDAETKDGYVYRPASARPDLTCSSGSMPIRIMALGRRTGLGITHTARIRDAERPDCLFVEPRHDGQAAPGAIHPGPMLPPGGRSRPNFHRREPVRAESCWRGMSVMLPRGCANAPGTSVIQECHHLQHVRVPRRQLQRPLQVGSGKVVLGYRHVCDS